MRNNKRSNTAKVFSLVELLVVIAIIALLAALLLPALQQAKKMALSSQCQGNLRQCGIALTGYANDFDDWVIGGECYNNVVYKSLAEMMMGTGYAPRSSPYYAAWGCSPVKNGQVFQCPSLPPPAGFKMFGTLFPINGYTGTSVMSYGVRMCSYARWCYLGEKTGGPDNEFMRLSSLHLPSRFPYVVDTSGPYGDGSGNVVGMGQWREWNAARTGSSSSGVLHLRHNRRANVWMPDGHSASWALADTWEFKCADPGITGFNLPIGFNY